MQYTLSLRGRFRVRGGGGNQHVSRLHRMSKLLPLLVLGRDVVPTPHIIVYLPSSSAAVVVVVFAGD